MCTMRSGLAATIIAAMLLGAFGCAQREEQPVPPVPGETEYKMVTGFVVDVNGWLALGRLSYQYHNSSRVSAVGGTPLVLVDKEGLLYYPIPDSVPADIQNEDLAPYIQSLVEAYGMVVDRGGALGIAIDSVKEAEEQFFMVARDVYKDTTAVKGYVVDLYGWLVEGKRGSDYRKTAQACAVRGVPLVIVDHYNILYYPLVQDTVASNQNYRLMNMIGREVTVKGIVVERGGAQGIMMQEIM
jgi:hypothetical protein